MAKKNKIVRQPSLPKEYELNGRTWKIRYDADREGDLYGETSREQHFIKINKDKQGLRETLRHEFWHSVFAATGHFAWMGEEKEEALVRALEYASADIKAFFDLTEGVKDTVK